MSDEIDYKINYEEEYTSLYLAVLDAGLHIIDGPQGRKVQMPLGVLQFADYEDRLFDSIAKFKTQLADKNARLSELEDRLHERDLAVATLAQQLSERDAAWKRAVWKACWMVWHMSGDDYNAEHGATEEEITEAVDYAVAVALHYLKSEGGGA